jgi:hypothetical protein
MSNNTALLSTAYFPNIQYISKFLLFERIYIEQYDHYQKQSFRNRCVIYAANGPLTLVVPVKKNHGRKMIMKDVQIDYDTNWQHQHWKSIHSAYKNSPFFDYYEDDFLPFFQKQEKYLIDLNLRITDMLLQSLNVNAIWEKTTGYVHDFSNDFRERIHPKPRLAQPDIFFAPASYHQVFSDKYGFIANLCIADLLFNEGPSAMAVVKKSTGEL